jgi:hypothetical protein
MPPISISVGRRAPAPCRTGSAAGRHWCPCSDTMVTPSASEIRKNAASEASSFSSVARATRPAQTATTKPATSPPPVIANRFSPNTRKPSAAPGRIACAMASPIRLIRRSIRNTPIGAGAERERQRADQRAAHEFELANGAMRSRRSSRRLASRRSAGGGLLVERLAHAPRRAVVGVSTSAVSPQATGSRASSSACGKFACARVRDRAAPRSRCASPRASAAPARADRRTSWRRWR